MTIGTTQRTSSTRSSLSKRLERFRPSPETQQLFLVYFLISMVLIVGGTYLAVTHFYRELPDLAALENIYDRQKLSTVVYSSDGVELRALYEREKRSWITYDRIPTCMIDALMAIEDQRFFKHWGVSGPDIFRAVVKDVVTLSFGQGGSTITQQLAKNLYYGREKRIARKFKEMLTAIQIERTYTKPEILEMYLNKVELGNNTFGIEAATQLYFGKSAEELTVPEAALLAGMIQSSSLNNPRSQIESRRLKALRRRNLTLHMMADMGKISHAQAALEIEKPVELVEPAGSGHGLAPYFVEHVRRELIDLYGFERVTSEGLKVETTLDSRLQQIAEQALAKQLDNIQKNYADKRIRYRRPPGISEEEAVKDSLARTVVQGALVALDVRTGKILAMVGGAGDYGSNYFNRATQAERQAGSSFKPFVYTAALDNGWRCCDTILDAYVRYDNVDGRGKIWEPQNFEKEFNGVISLREAIKKSVNIVSIKLMNDTENRGVGPETVIKYARSMGITTRLEPVKSLAVGTGHVKLLELVSAYTIFPNMGVKTTPFSILTVHDKNGNELYSQPNGEGAKNQVLDPGVASLMVTMLRSVTTEGTARTGMETYGMTDRPSAGKTGTGNDYKDAWFIGFTPYIACGVWVGFDSEETILGGNLFGTGSAAALPVWIEFVKGASDVLKLPKDDFRLEGVTTQRICRDSYKKATALCPQNRVYTEFFLPGTELVEECPVHGGQRRDSRGLSPAPGVNPAKRGY